MFFIYLNLNFNLISAGSSCGVSVCLVKPRRLTEWWRLLLRDTATVTPASSRAPVTRLTITLLFMKWCSSPRQSLKPSWRCSRPCLPPVRRHVLRAVVCHHHAEHKPPQPKREGQTWSGPLYLDEPRHQRGGGLARGAAQSMTRMTSNWQDPEHRRAVVPELTAPELTALPHLLF